MSWKLSERLEAFADKLEAWEGGPELAGYAVGVRALEERLEAAERERNALAAQLPQALASVDAARDVSRMEQRAARRVAERSERAETDMLRRLRKAEAERDAALARIEAVRALHVEDDRGYCEGCTEHSPCPTIRALEVKP